MKEWKGCNVGCLAVAVAVMVINGIAWFAIVEFVRWIVGVFA